MEMSVLPVANPTQRGFGRLSSRADKFALVSKVWPDSGLTLGSFDEEEYDEYLEYVEDLVRQIEHHRTNFAAQTLAGTAALIEVLRNQSDQPQAAIIDTVAGHYLNCSQSSIQLSLELAARIWLTVNVSSPKIAVGPIYPQEERLAWDADTSLNSLIESQFAVTRAYALETGSNAIEHTFSAAYLVGVCGFQLRWVGHLNDHLKVDLTIR
jgi:hypothetical protein